MMIDQSQAKKELLDYLIGYGFSIALSLIAFGVVVYLKDYLSIGVLASILALCALVQIVVQFVYFLHIRKSDNDGWNLAALFFTGIILLMIVGGSGWVMFYLHMNMMPELPL
ncbi:cytochrome o ubiquinol oxidase subunit IV [Ignatzschineria rhizosphaerae]|uniref:Cytochrome bo(3) ubiquinol oxidase subunit 4 n=1 Tax=Ignatzschineria rhizosphaerae TaxID=2923279 RepID=A0ABY3X3V1_9GAMM|nr:cytochrome o ubiquinol oxidase subunit IV [Ignatzschineria rhizosphaerae]UNM95445.1 cytochrome o ubiquinol oxidase subunit IV [Ignatzschineria rhizosphaerae]